MPNKVPSLVETMNLFCILCLTLFIYFFLIWERNLVFMSSEEEKKTLTKLPVALVKPTQNFRSGTLKPRLNHTLSISFMK